MLMKLLSTNPRLELQKPYVFAFCLVLGEGQEKIVSLEYSRGLYEQRDQLQQLCDREPELRKKHQAELEYFSELTKLTYQGELDSLQEFIAQATGENKTAVVESHAFGLVKPEILLAELGILPDRQRPLPIVNDRHLDNTSPDLVDHWPQSIPNPTILPDRMLPLFTPVILIRHPARSCASYLKMREKNHYLDFPIMVDFKWSRLIFDAYSAFYRSNPSTSAKTVIVVDSEKVVADPEGQMEKLGNLLGVDSSLFKYSWEAEVTSDDPAGNESALVILRDFLSDIKRSTGGVSGPADLDAEVKKWSKHAGENAGKQVKDFLESAMEDYEYLLKFSI
ncbi:hypothetical protein K435DRAFT_762302 [Dendrothele bispora CBS 962.96]|uniref:Sulfotransferase domain-containing protein n=1 Tax=Dendrothele bispora (strain CBS 962.96) TaxID=1314807 RepID=A0A4S8LFR8_DENBC|nr:hypothetical protein K435DRAFT_762302 [Dendrothele bispora CBS 962.96]